MVGSLGPAGDLAEQYTYCQRPHRFRQLCRHSVNRSGSKRFPDLTSTPHHLRLSLCSKSAGSFMCTCSYHPASYAEVSCVSWLVDIAFHILFKESNIRSSEYGMYTSIIKCLQDWTGIGNLLNL